MYQTMTKKAAITVQVGNGWALWKIGQVIELTKPLLLHPCPISTLVLACQSLRFGALSYV